MVTVAGVGFSITIVALVLASTQFGPRLLGLFMRDITSQATLGTFVGTFTYCVLVLRTIRGPDEAGGAFVPQVAMTIAIGITLLSVAVLVYFFHHVAVTIQAPNVVSTVAHDLDAAIDHLRKPDLGVAGPAPAADEIPDPDVDTVLAATRSGYVQVVDDAALLEVALRHDLRVRLMTRPGLFVVQGNPLIVARPSERVDDGGDRGPSLDAHHRRRSDRRG